MHVPLMEIGSNCNIFRSRLHLELHPENESQYCKFKFANLHAKYCTISNYYVFLKIPTEDLEGLVWAPDGRAIAVFECNLSYLVLFISPMGHELGSHQAYENGLGIRSISWSPNAQFVAVSSYDEKV
jgi:hypothetical protein